jgi:hypothetical protein
MEDNNWYAGIKKQIDSIKTKMSKGDYSAYELDGFLRVSKRISSLSDECSQCTHIKEEITNTVHSLVDWPDTSKKQLDEYVFSLRTIIEHLKENHELDLEGRKKNLYTGITLIIGAIAIPLLLAFILHDIFRPEGMGDLGFGVVVIWIVGILALPVFIVGIINIKRGLDSIL